MALKIVQEIRVLEKDRKLPFETSGNFTRAFTSIGLAFKRLHHSILEADEFTQKLADKVDKAPWKEFYKANGIKKKFESLNKALSCFQADVDSALQVNAVRERAEISEMLHAIKPHLTELKDTEHNYILAMKDDFKDAKTELLENLKQIQQGM